MSLDPEEFWKSMESMRKVMGQTNKFIMRSAQRWERASTKIVAASSRSHGLMMGVVADLDLMTGAFGRMKRFLANIFLPLGKDASRSAKSMRTFMEFGMHPLAASLKRIKPALGAVKAYSASFSQRLKQHKVENLITKHRTRLINDRTSQELPMLLKLRSRLAPVWDQFHKWTDVLEQVGRGESARYVPSSKMVGTGWKQRYPKSTKPSPFTGAKGPHIEAPLPGLGALAKMPGAKIDFGRMGKAFGTVGKGAKHMAKVGTGKFVKGAKFFNKEVAKPLGQIASGGIGLGFQATIIMGLMQAFASIFTIFQPIIDIVGMLMERLSIGFMPLIEILMEILTSEPVLAMIDMLSAALAQIFEMFKPLVPIIIMIIQAALKPLSAILDALMPIIKILADLFGTIMIALMPLIEILFGVLAPVITMLAKLFALLVVIGMYPLMGALYGVGIVIATLMDIFTLYTKGYTRKFHAMMSPIFAALNVATGQVIASFQGGTDYVPRTGLYMLHRGEGVDTAAENLRGQSKTQTININIDGGIWVQDLDELVSMVGRKLSLIRG